MRAGVATHKGLEVVEVPDRASWRTWLAANFDTSPGVWLVFHKKNSTRRSQSYDEAIEEALAFGWIDSTTNRLDEERYMLLLTPRKQGSVWARSNKNRVERLVAEGRMAPPGLAKVEAAKRDGSWNALDDVEDLIVPDDLAAALAEDPAAQAFFEALPDSMKKMALHHVGSAKRAETRERRIAQTVQSAADGTLGDAWRPRPQ